MSKFQRPLRNATVLAISVFSLAACGGGKNSPSSLDSSSNNNADRSLSGLTVPVDTPASSPTVVQPAPATPPKVVVAPLDPKAKPFVCDANALTCVQVSSTSSATQATVPVTFGMPFKAGDMAPTDLLEGIDGTTKAHLPVQVDSVSTRSDIPPANMRMAVLTTQVTNLGPLERRVINLYKTTTAIAPITPSASSYSLDIDATVYQPQITRVTLGSNTAGFKVGDVVTIQLGDEAPLSVNISADMAGTNIDLQTKIAQAFQDQMAARSGSKFKAFRPTGAGSAYQSIWFTTVNPEGGKFTVKAQSTGTGAIQNVDEINYAPATQWGVSANSALVKAIAADTNHTMRGPFANEYTLVLPFNLKGASTPTPHPQLTARLHVRLYGNGSRARTDMVIENDWAYNSGSGNITYALSAKQNNTEVFYQPAFTHNHHSRWHKIIWQGDEVKALVRHDSAYFMATKVVWNYDYTLPIPESVLQDEATKLAAADTSVMGSAFITRAFPNTGGRWDIGPYPRWTALYLITQDERARNSMLANADAAAGIPVHYRDTANDQPLSLDLHPGVVLQFGTPTPKDALPAMTGHYVADWSPDTSHQGSFAFVPYLITGDLFYLDEMMFWASYNMGVYNPGYRNYSDGLLTANQVRGQAWSLRSIGEAARALPDKHPARAYYVDKLTKNINWYNNAYVDKMVPNTASPLGAMEYESQIAPWQQDFMSIVLDQLMGDGYSNFKSFHGFSNKFTVGRFAAHPAFCIQAAPAYYLKIHDSTGAYISTWNALYEFNRAAGLLLASADATCSATMAINGYPDESGGYAAYAKAMLAAAANVNFSGAKAAYDAWDAWTPLMRKAYLTDPTWAIVPASN